MEKFWESFIWLCVAGIFSLLSYEQGYKAGFHKGGSIALDTVQQLMNKQIDSDTTVTELVLVNPDTLTYYLSPKHLKK